MKTKPNSARLSLLLAMGIFGTIGILRRFIPLSSSLVALVRGVIGSAFLILVLLVRRQTPDKSTIRRFLPALLLSGVCIGFNWILLFEAYNYTSVATATLCYYLAPILVILAAPFVTGERITRRKALCTAVALAGMVLVSGVPESGFGGIQELKGIVFGLGAAALYACAILINKKMPGIGAWDKTTVQLLAASAALLPYVLFTEDLSSLPITLPAALLLLVAGIVHTGIAYTLYFGSMDSLSANTVALMSYLDPVLAIILSMVVLHEPMTIGSAMGAVLILGAAWASEQ